MTNVAFLGSVLILILLIVTMVVNMASTDSVFLYILGKLPETFNLIVVCFVVFVPEGLGLVIGISLAFSAMKIYSVDKILVRNLESPEVMGTVEEILCGKTGTLTEAEMNVSKFIVEGKLIKNSRKNTLFNCELAHETIERVKESILYNCEARVEMDAT